MGNETFYWDGPRVFPMQFLASSSLPQKILNFPLNLFTHFDEKLKNSLELPNPTRNTRKFANKLMTDTSGEIKLQSKQDIICHVAKVKPATSAHYVADVIPFFSVRSIPFESNASIKPEKCFPHTVKKHRHAKRARVTFLVIGVFVELFTVMICKIVSHKMFE